MTNGNWCHDHHGYTCVHAPRYCAECGIAIYGGFGGYHDADGCERCGDGFHEPVAADSQPRTQD